MALSLATVGAKITATFMNLIIAVVNKQGTTSVIPTSVAGTGVTLGAAGKVTFSASTAVSVNGCFTSTYDNYLLVFDLTTSGAAGLNIALRLAGTDAATAYDSQRMTAVNATVSALQSLNTSNWVGSGGIGVASATHSGTMTLFSPALAVATRAQIDNNITPNPMTTSAGYYKGTLLHRTTTAYDGFTFTPGTGNITGNVRIYGFNNN